jgi:hypothetical protein
VRATTDDGVELAVTDHGGPANLELPDVVDALVEEFLASVEIAAGVGGRA